MDNILGKRKSRTEMYVDSLMESPEKKEKKALFEQRLRQFYRKKWNAPVKAPLVHGLEFDLFKLFDVVMAFGGWQKVSHLEKWPDVAEQFGIKDDILGGDNAVKILYMRYLSKYEQYETVGDMDEMMDPEMMRSRGNRTGSFLATSECPVYIPRMTQYESRGGNNGPDYGRLTKSLMSGLANEADMAMNVLTLMSHPGPRLLRLHHAPHLVNLLLAHIGIFDPEDKSMCDLYASWETTLGRDFQEFWANVGIHPDYLKIFLPQAAGKTRRGVGDDLLVGIGPSYSANDPLSWRVYQVASIIRAFSFEAVNRVALSENWEVIRFCVLAANCSWTQLETSAMDTLGNIASDLDLSNSRLLYQSGHSILRTVSDAIFSDDKYKLIRGMEVLSSLSGAEENEGIICQFMQNSLLTRIFSCLVIKDIMLCVYALECIYQLSEMGSLACDVICELPHAITTLISMASIEAVSFGQSGLAGMKVVEYHAPGTLPQMQQGHFPPQHVQHQGMSIQHIPPPAQFTHGPLVQGPPTVSQVAPMGVVPVAQPVISSVRVAPSTAPSTQSPSRPGDSRMEQLTAEWISSSCEADEGTATSRGDLYAAYVDDMRNIHHSLSCSLQAFTNIIKRLLPSVSFTLPDNGTAMLAVGLRLNKPHKLIHGSSTVTSPASHPIMRSILDKREGEGEGRSPAKKGMDTRQSSQVCSEAVEADSVLPDCGIHEAKILRVENTGGAREAATSSLKSEVAKRIREKEAEKKAAAQPEEEKEDKKKEDEEGPIDGIVKDDEKKDEAEEEKGEKIANEGEEKNEGGVKDATEAAGRPYVDVDRGELMCEWDGCGRKFEAAPILVHHATSTHLKDDVMGVCRWPGCDATRRSKWSLVTHLQDHHANEASLTEAAKKRREGRLPALPPKYCAEAPREMPHHPGYSESAAADAIRRHSLNFVQKDFTEEAEGPVTKSIRLTACLILRNIARYSVEGRGLLRRHEERLSWMALSRLESGAALAQLLAELPHEREEAMNDEAV